jgi:release factor glutamine methyltransferase
MPINQFPFQASSEELLSLLIERYSSKISQLPDKPEETPTDAMRALWLCAAGIHVSVVCARDIPLPKLSDEQKSVLTELLEKRTSGIPLAHLTGRQHFMGLEFLCSPHALIPRKETELLGNAALKIIKERLLPSMKHPRVLDVCTGCGNLACALAVHAPEVIMYASDLSADAVGLARENAEQYKLGNRFIVRAGDLFEPFAAEEFMHSFNLIVCNPPYITSTKVTALPSEIGHYEPKMAFDAGPLGLAIITRLLREVTGFLAPQGWLAFEIGLGQGPFLLQRINKLGWYKNIENITNENGEIRGFVVQCL